MPRYRARDFGTSLANVSAAERELAASIAGGKRYPDRAALRGKVRRMTRQREALERAEQRAADRSWSDLTVGPSFVPRSPLEQRVLELGGVLVSEEVVTA